MSRPIRKIKLHTDEFVDSTFVKNSCEACNVRTHPSRFYSATSKAGEYNRLAMKAERICRKTWSKMLSASDSFDK